MDTPVLFTVDSEKSYGTLGTFVGLDPKSSEQIACIVRSGGGLGMILHGEDRKLLISHAL